ncbi:MAG TPA: UDP-N-acetylglucosamine pyrophosphorylase [Clostridiales bacterium]|nr:UDP-N-acetylglucosamine pyrophosphorylase [Clostridiales bacterium]
MNIPKITDLFDLSHTAAGNYLSRFSYGHEALEGLSDFIRALGRTLGDDYEEISPEVYIAKDATIAPSAVIEAPTVIGHGAEVRPGAFIRGSALIGDGAVVGNSTEIKNAILFDGVQAPHYNYIGDSILGYKAHMGAGAVASNFRADHGNITVRSDEEEIPTGRRKLGTMLGDRAEIGCHTVLCPGSMVGRDSIVYPLVRLRGVVAEKKIVKDAGVITDRK